MAAGVGAFAWWGLGSSVGHPAPARSGGGASPGDGDPLPAQSRQAGSSRLAGARSDAPGTAGKGTAPGAPPERSPPGAGGSRGTSGASERHPPAGGGIAIAAPCGADDQGPVARPSPVVPWNLRVEELFARTRARLEAARAGDARLPGDELALTRALRRALGPDSGAEDWADLAEVPGRRTRDGFDLAVGAALAQASRSWSRGALDAALDAVSWARRLDPGDGVPALAAALVLERLGRPDEALRAWEEAHRLAPEEPAIALALGRRLATTPRAAPAAHALEAYLDALAPGGDPGIAELAERLRRRAAGFSGAEPRTLDGVHLLVAPDAPAALDLRARRALHLDLVRALSEAAWLTGTERRPELTVLVHGSRNALHDATCSPAWTDALYDGSLHLHAEALLERGRRDRTLRHEVLHAQLHALPLSLPRWFDEGLAQYFAGEGDTPAARQSFRVMVDNRTWVPFPSLEDSFLVIEAPRDAGLAYHQSVAMVDYLVTRFGRGVVAEAVSFLAKGGDGGDLLAALAGGPLDGQTLLAHVQAMLDRPPR